ncbi:hypothetical protein B0T22DRAFT_517226 [Podospora appendiculata]|uniref:Ankyrin n=1 Tax=Podospora appendiculata TaxID=314037 RepID=A0AAE1CA47_9PEZI|nr:hypothetical protein B0T22DRAFT_517226 [Podospora appendiculata]
MAFAIQHAKQLLQAHRAVQAGEQPFGRLRSPFSSNDGFTYQEVNRVLGEVVDSDGPVGVINALLALGADVNFHMRQKRNKITRKQHDGQRSDLLLRATLRCQAETVNAIAAHADQENLDRALHHAIVRGDLDVVRALLNHGASPVHLHDDFQDAIFQNQVELVELLLSGHRLPCLACRSTGLRIAVKNRSLAIASLLLRYWADVNYDDAVALLRAVEMSRPDLVSVLISGPVRPSPRSLDAAVGKAHDLMGKNDTQEGRQIIETCLSAGAAGPSTTRLMTEGLIVAVQRGHTQFLDTILRLRKPQGQYEAFALLEAIRAGQITTLVKLLEFSPSPASLTVAASQAVKISDARARYATAQLLIQAGATGACTADALVRTVHRLTCTAGEKAPRVSVSDKAVDEQLLRLLLDEGKADVDFGDGEALQGAVQTSCMPIAEAIVARRPSAKSLGAALPWAMNISNKQERQAMVTLLLRHEISPESAGKALVEAFKAETPGLALIETLLTRACVNWNNGEVFIFAIRNFRPEAFRLLLGQGISYKALFTATHEALRCPERPHRRAILGSLLGRLQLDHLNTALKHIILERETDISLASVLLDAGAEATYQDGVCIKNAACHLDMTALRLLAEHSGPNESVFTQAFAAVINRGRQWIAFEHVEIVQLLLRHGASDLVVDKAMVDVVDHLACKDSELADVLLNIFFAAGAQADYENGKAVAIAAGRGDVSLLSRLLSHGATSTTATLALSTAIMAHHEEALLLQMIEVFADQRIAVANVNKSLPGMPSSLLLCLKSYGHSVVLLDRLVSMAGRAGCDLESTVPHQVYSEDPIPRDESRAASAVMEPVSVLMWALLQPAKMISSSVIAALVRHGADVSYTTPKTRVTPLLLAAQSGRCDVATLLLEAGAKISTRDVFGRSALFFASGLGDVNLVTLLLNRHPSNNDGSLHEAARGFHLHVIKLLFDAGHDPNYRSSRHQGRTPLGELALNGAVPHDTATAESAVDALCAAGASPLLKIHGKTTIFLSLDNKANNLPMTRLLLDKLLHRTLNSQENMYQHGVHHHSPTMYVAKGLLHGPASPALLQLLRDHGAEDRYYATMGEPQPPDVRGLPEEFREYENERQARERRIQQAEDEHVRYLRWERENEARGILSRTAQQQQQQQQQQNRNTSYSDSWAMPGAQRPQQRQRQRHSEGARAQKSFADLRHQSHSAGKQQRLELDGTSSPRTRDGGGAAFIWAGKKLQIDHLYQYQQEWPGSPVAAVELETNGRRGVPVGGVVLV